MAEYIDRKRYMKEKYNCDLIKIDDAELVPLYQIINRLEESIERSKIDNAIKEIEKRSFDNEPFIIGECLKTYRDEVLKILKRNIVE